MLMFTLTISCLTASDLPWFMGPGSHAILFFTASDFTSITSHIHNWMLFLLWLHLFILFGVISPLISSSILGTYRPEEFIFQCPIFSPFHNVHGVLKARVLKWFAIPFSSGPHFCQNSPPWPIHLRWPYKAWLIVSLHWTRLWSVLSVWLVFCDCSFHVNIYSQVPVCSGHFFPSPFSLFSLFQELSILWSLVVDRVSQPHA